MGNIYSIQDNVQFLFEGIETICSKNNKNFKDIKIMGVSKTRNSQEVEQAIQAGIEIFGENKVQELIAKSETFKKHNKPCHIIGQLQTNKVKYLPPLTDFIQSVDSIKLVQEIEKQYSKAGLIANVLVEVNIGQEENKGGISKEKLEEFIYEASNYKSISVKGLMCVPPICENDRVRRYFEEMNKLFVDISLKKVDNINMSVLSMGMSHDYQYAIQEGSTLVRIGQGIFGQRNY